MKYYLTFLMLLVVGLSTAQELSGTDLLNRAIAFHDPTNQWPQAKLEFLIDMETPNSTSRRSLVTIDNSKGTFSLKILNRGSLTEYVIDGNDSVDFSYNFLPPADSIQADTLGLTKARAIRWRDYYSYLYGLPMKLKDPGTVIDPETQTTTFMGEEVLALKVTYDANVGEDTWYFYFRPDTYQMIGYRFYHDEEANDGEYIVLKGMEINKGLRIPKDRTWYTNSDDRILGTDFLVDFKVRN